MPQTEKDRHNKIGDPESGGRKPGVCFPEGLVREPGYQRHQKKSGENLFIEAAVEAGQYSSPDGELR